jgi:hypothetical protein
MDQALSRLPPALPGPFDTRPAASGMVIAPAVSSLVHSQVQALLEASPSFYALSPAKRASIGRDLEKIAAYTAALVHEEWAQSQALGQRPMLRQRVSVPVPAEAAAAADSWSPPADAAAAAPPSAQALRGDTQDRFAPRAVNQVARVTRDTLNAIAFPTFVADLIKGTFQAIIDASIQQMEAYGTLLANVSKTVDQFMADNISDNNARDWLVGAYPGHLKIDLADGAPKLVPREGAEDRGKPDLKGTLGLDEEIDITDERAVEERLVPAARRHLARGRHQMLSTMMLMGINRIVVTSGRIGAKMGFHIQAQDTGAAESASQFDFRHQNRIGFGGGIAGLLGGPSGEARTSVAYVSSTRRGSSDSIDVSADLTGEVDLKFKSDYFPMERFAKPELMSLIMGHTPNPAANTPVSNIGGEAGAARTAAPGAAP